MEATREELVAAHLRYGAIAEPLRERGLAHVVGKCLFSAGRGNSLSHKGIAARAEDMLGDWRPRGDDVASALEILEGRGWLRKTEDGFALETEAWHRIDDQLQERRRRMESIYRRHFPSDISLDRFRSWFEWACIDFFTEYGKRWVAMVVRDASLLPEGGIDLRGLLSSSIYKHDLDDRFEELADGFLRFIKSREQQDKNHLWSLGQAMFAARLAAAGTGADPITKRALSNSIVFLDTNTLLDIALEERVHRDAVQALGRALDAIDVDLRFTSETEDEYRGHIDRKAEFALQAIEGFGVPLARDTGDEAILTALGRGCNTLDDFDQFFTDVRAVPSTINGSVSIQLLETQEVATGGREGWENDAQVNEIINFAEQRGRNPKSEYRARHDSALTDAARRLRVNDSACWILSRDRGMTDLAVEWCGPTSTPLWVGLDALLQVLAVDEEPDSGEFATIFASLVANEVEIASTTYELADLQYLDERHAQVAALPDQDVKELASFVHQRRLAGAGRDDKELRLELSRRVQERVSRQLEEAGEARERFERIREESRLTAERAERAREAAERARHQAGEIEEHLIEERKESLVKKTKLQFWLRLLGWFTVIVAVTVAAIVVYIWVQPDVTNRLDLFVVSAGLAGPVLGTLLGLFTKVLPWRRRQIREARSQAQRQLREEGRIG